MLFMLIGKSASGKDTLMQYVLTWYKKIKPLVTYTTRPRRANEQDGVNYHFVSEEEMLELESFGCILEKRCYNTTQGYWYYFTCKDEQLKDNVITIGTLESFSNLKHKLGNVIVPIYVDMEPERRLRFAINRACEDKEPDFCEVCRRFLADESDYSNSNLELAGIPESNVFFNSDSQETAKKIIKFMEDKINA